MKKTATTAILAALCAWTAAASETTLSETNLAQPLNIDLTATIAGAESTIAGVAVQSATHIHLTTADVISALGVSLGATFPTNAQLLLTESTGGALTVAVKGGSNAAVDVTGFFVFEASSNHIESVSFSTNTGTLVTNVQALETFGFQNDSGATALTWHFSVSGVATVTYAGIDSSGTVTEDGFALSAQVSGSGDYDGAFALYQGFISAGAGAGCGGPGGPGGPGGLGGPGGPGGPGGSGGSGGLGGPGGPGGPGGATVGPPPNFSGAATTQPKARH